jgi:carboxymethylenebutenolidase
MQTASYSGVITSTITFGDRVNAFLAVPERGTGPFAAVLLGHERYGLVQYTRNCAARLAQNGYACLAPDLYSRWDGDIGALNRGDIQAPVPDDEVRSYLGESLDFLLNDSRVDPRRIAVMGACQSGPYPPVLNSIRPEIVANIMIYGGAQARDWKLSEYRREPYEGMIERLTAPVLGIWGEKDHLMTIDNVCRLRNTLEAKRKTYEFHMFPDMPHGWMDPTMPGRYREAETEAAWRLILDFLGRAFRGEFPRDRVCWRFESDISVAYDPSTHVRLA